MKHHKFHIIVCICLIVGLLPSACAPRNTSILSTCPDVKQSIQRVLDFAHLPDYLFENPIRTGSEFDPKAFFEILPNLSMKEGYVLDYVYYAEGGGGEPILYARPTDQKPYTSTDEFLATQGGETADYIFDDIPEYLDYLEIVDSPQGYFEFVMFKNYVEQFYLFGLAGYRFNDMDIVCNKETVEQIIAETNASNFGAKFTEPQQKQAEAMRFIEPRVTMNKDTAVVEITSFTIWGGFYKQTFTINRSSPHKIQFNETNIVPYESGIEV
jgi:hypothetical protein